MSIAEGGVRDQQAILLLDPAYQPICTIAVKDHFSGFAVFDVGIDQRKPLQRCSCHCGATLHFRIAVYDDFTKEPQKLGSPVPACGEVEQLRGVIDKARGENPGAEVVVTHDTLQERQVGLDATNAELRQSTAHPGDALISIWCRNRNFCEQRVIVWRDHSTGKGRTTIQTNAEASRGAVGNDFAVIRNE